MNLDEKIEHLQGMLDRPEGKYTHAQIREKLNQLTGGVTNESINARRAQLGADDPGGPIDLNKPPQTPKAPTGGNDNSMLTRGPLASSPAPVDDSFHDRMIRGSERLFGTPGPGKAVNWANEVPAMGLYKAIDAALLGLPSGAADELSGATGTQIGPSPQMRQQFQEQHPKTAMAAEFIGNVSPVGAPAKIARGTARAIDPLTAAISRRMTTAPGRAAVKTLESGAVGGVTGAATGAARKLVEGGTSGEALEAGVEGGKSGAAFGTGFGAASGAAREGARAIRARSPDIRVLDEAGLEPGPLPGMPVIRKDQSVLGQFPGTTPPLVQKATPDTRASAGRVAADEIVPDIRARSMASNQRFGELQRQAYAAEGNNPAPVNHILADIDSRLGNLSLPPATKAALATVRQQIVENSIPQGGRSILNARQIDQIRDLADTMVKRGDTKGDVQLIQVSENLRNTLASPGVGPGIAALNAQQSDVMKGFTRVRGLLGVPKSAGEPSERSLRQAAGRITERGEQTKSGGTGTGAQGHAIDRLIAEGPPQMLPGSQGPAQFDYKALLDVPRQQLAQERLQLNPSSLFSGAGGVTVGPMTAVGRALARTPTRLAYPAMRRGGDAELGGKGVAIDEAMAARRRGKKKKERKEAESMKEGER